MKRKKWLSKGKKTTEARSLVLENIVTDPNLWTRMRLKDSFTFIISPVNCSMYKPIIHPMSIAPAKWSEMPTVWCGKNKMGYRIRNPGLKLAFTCCVIFASFLTIRLVSSSVKWGQLHLLPKGILREEWNQEISLCLVDTKTSITICEENGTDFNSFCQSKL